MMTDHLTDEQIEADVEVTPEKRAEIRAAIESAPDQLITLDVADVLALLADSAERDALAAKVERLTGELVDAGYRQEEDRAELGALRAMLAGRCLSDITHRDEEHWLGDHLTRFPDAEPVWRGPCDRGVCAAELGHEGTCAEASGWDEP